MKSLVQLTAFLLLLGAIALEVVSAVSYPTKIKGNLNDDLKKGEDVMRYHNLALILVIASVALYLNACAMK